MSEKKARKKGASGKTWRNFLAIRGQLCSPPGSGMMVVILVLAFMLTVGVAVLAITTSGPKVSASMRYQEEAFNVAEAGFEAARIRLSEEGWSDFGDLYLKGLTTGGIDVPFIGNDPNTPNPGYFRSMTDEQILSLIDKDHDGQFVFFEEPYAYDQTGAVQTNDRFTVFLIDKGAGSGSASDPLSALMVCIGVVRSGPNASDKILATSRLEIEIEIGMTP
ncbi:MAG TPA: hypothetical protein PKU99_05235 [Candidatus Saccharicenans sp.]|nr:hypothetical protein [Candidatus Saccharicenans sp.]